MPEGLEVFVLGRALLHAGLPPDRVDTHGKHLYVNGMDWSFGLWGRVHLDAEGVLTKVPSSGDGRTGAVVPLDASTRSKLGVDFATGTAAAFAAAIQPWRRSKRPLGTLLLDQSGVAGVGVAWGSEMLARCGLRPDKPANAQDLSPLAQTMVHVRDEALQTYFQSPTWHEVNAWFHNLYATRHMAVYKKGTPVMVAGRQWWVVG